LVVGWVFQKVEMLDVQSVAWSAVRMADLWVDGLELPVVVRKVVSMALWSVVAKVDATAVLMVDDLVVRLVDVLAGY
jgi:hypothetical protein